VSDKELLRLAAKAIGIGPVCTYEKRRNCLRIGSRESYSVWKPLNDDGDAMRLAVNLGIDVNHGGSGVVAERRAVFNFPEVGVCEGFTSSEQVYTATRRAIVRAAAEIGRSMP